MRCIIVYEHYTHHLTIGARDMYKYYSNYYWCNGKPKGIGLLTEGQVKEDTSYRIVVDPYFKRFTVEIYNRGKFTEIAYDSALFDFRRLKPVDQNAWQKETIVEDENETVCLIRNQDDRVIITERYLFESGLCTKCEISYPNGQLLSTQKISYTHLGDDANLVTLYDRLMRPVLIKKYEADEDNGEFTTLIEENWDMKDFQCAIEN